MRSQFQGGVTPRIGHSASRIISQRKGNGLQQYISPPSDDITTKDCQINLKNIFSILFVNQPLKMLSLLQLAKALLALGPLASATLLARRQRGFCDSQPDADILALHEKLTKDKPNLTRRDAGELISLDAWVHVVAANETNQGGWLTVNFCFYYSLFMLS